MNVLQYKNPSSTEISSIAEHLFRHETGRLVSILTRIFGADRMHLAEDVVQEALIRALQTWPYYGIPEKPIAWITQTAKNLALDVIRREKRFRDKQPQIVRMIQEWSTDSSVDPLQAMDSGMQDDRLRLIFVCCHPAIAQEAQIALALKTLCGFNAIEIAKAFLTTEAAINKRLTRARQSIRKLKIEFEIPEGAELSERLDAVFKTLYLLFNEGYKVSTGDDLIREEFCFEAIRLTTMLAEHPVGKSPETYALLALMLLNAARLSSRVDTAGNLLRLEEQDRSKWNKEMIARGMFCLSQSAAGEELTTYHLQAAIAALHCSAADYASTDWKQILSLYDQLVCLDDSPIVALNRAVAVAEIHGPQAGIQAVEAIPNAAKLNSYYLYYAILGEFELKLNNFGIAANHLRKAHRLTNVKSERMLLDQKIKDLGH
ncbi:sigma-70 family RNA polymerase sigma factor [bacterium]|nr:sigma-70 family RNA polymerase sigma factor [bacterium]